MMTSSLGDVSLCWREILLTEWKHYCAKLLSSTHLFLFSEGKKKSTSMDVSAFCSVLCQHDPTLLQ